MNPLDINAPCPYTAIEPRVDQITGKLVRWLVECRWPAGHVEYNGMPHKPKWPCDIPSEQLIWVKFDDSTM
jgi:hypothetical protein